MLRMRRISTSSKKPLSYEGIGFERRTKLYTLIAMTEDFNVLACCRSVGFPFVSFRLLFLYRAGNLQCFEFIHCIVVRIHFQMRYVSKKTFLPG